MSFLACSGGGDRGIVFLGMVKQLYEEFNVKYDEMAGISAGALVCSLLSMTKNYKEDLDKKIDILLDKKFSVTQPWSYYLNVVDAYFFHQSIYNSKPLKDLIEQNFDADKIKIPF